MEEGESQGSLFTDEYVASSRFNAIEKIGGERVELIDETTGGFVEGEESYDPDSVFEFLSDTFRSREEYVYSIISYAKSRASAEKIEDKKNASQRVLQIATDLYRLNETNG